MASVKKMFVATAEGNVALLDDSDTHESLNDAIDEACENATQDEDYIVWELRPVRRVVAGKPTIKTLK